MDYSKVCPTNYGGNLYSSTTGIFPLLDLTVCTECTVSDDDNSQYQPEPDPTYLPCVRCTDPLVAMGLAHFCNADQRDDDESGCRKSDDDEDEFCPVQCIHSRYGVKEGCVDIIDFVLKHYAKPIGGGVGGTFAFFLAVLFYFRYKKRNGGLRGDNKKNIFGVNTNPILSMSADGNAIKTTSRGSMVEMNNFGIVVGDVESRKNKRRQELEKGFESDDYRRIGYKMSDDDLKIHACRIYLLGSNDPFNCNGGPWVLSHYRPVTLRPTVNREQFRNFANIVNATVAWNLNCWELMLYYIIYVFIPPFAAPYLVREDFTYNSIFIHALVHIGV